MKKTTDREMRKPGPEQKTGQIGSKNSESHGLEKEADLVKKELWHVNRELGTDKRKTRLSMIWIVMILLYVSMIITTAGVMIERGDDHANTAADRGMTAMEDHSEQIMIVDEMTAKREADRGTESETVTDTEKETDDRDTADIEKKIAETPDDKRYQGVMLESIVPARYENYRGESVIVETIIDLKGPERINLTAEYGITDPQGKNVYSYSEEVEISQSNDILRKSILFTENYPEGEYTIGFRGWFEMDGTRYVLPGKTKILVLKKPTVEAAKTSNGSMNMINVALLALILLLNIQLLFNALKPRHEEKRP